MEIKAIEWFLTPLAGEIRRQYFISDDTVLLKEHALKFSENFYATKDTSRKIKTQDRLEENICKFSL